MSSPFAMASKKTGKTAAGSAMKVATRSSLKRSDARSRAKATGKAEAGAAAFVKLLARHPLSRAPKLERPFSLVPMLGPKSQEDLRALGFSALSPALAAQDPEEMYRRMVSLKPPQCRCVCYVFRCAVYHARASDDALEINGGWPSFSDAKLASRYAASQA